MTTYITTINPATGAVLADHEAWTPKQIDQAVDRAAAAAAFWGQQLLGAGLESRIRA